MGSSRHLSVSVEELNYYPFSNSGTCPMLSTNSPTKYQVNEHHISVFVTKSKKINFCMLIIIRAGRRTRTVIEDRIIRFSGSKFFYTGIDVRSLLFCTYLFDIDICSFMYTLSPLGTLFSIYKRLGEVRLSIYL